MSIEKYKKSTPDVTISNSAWLSTDNSDLRGYKLVNAENIGLEWCYATNYNNTKRYDKTYINVGDKTIDTVKTGLFAESIEQTTLYGVSMYKVNIVDDNFEWGKVGAGIAVGLLHYDPFTPQLESNYKNLYVIENLDYSKIFVTATGYSTGLGTWSIDTTDGERISTNGMYVSVRAFDKVSKTLKDLPSGLNLNLFFGTISDEFTFIDRLGCNATTEPMIQIGTRWQSSAYTAYTNQIFEKPYRTNGNYNLAYCMATDDKYVQTVVLPLNDFAKFTEKSVWQSQYGTTYGAFFTECPNCDDIIKAMNSTGLYYADSLVTTWNDFKENVHIGVMDKYGVTDCENRITGLDEIEASDLPNKDRSGYDWNIPDPTKPPSPDPSGDDIDDMKLGVGRNYAGMVKYYRLSPAQLLVFSQEIQKDTVVPAGYDVMRNIVALKRFPVNLSNYAEFSEPELIKLGSVTVPLSASQLAWEKKNISLGTYTIQGYHGTRENPHFLDFSPYTTAEVFIPYCGFVTIPTDKIMYNEIEVRLLVDVKLGNCTGIVKCNGNIVGEKSGVLGADIPLVAVNMGVAMGTIVQGLMDSTLGFVSAIPYAAAGNTAATFSGVLNGASALTQTIMSSKKNYTEVIGTTGGDIMFTMPDRCYIKLTYPKKELPSNYGKMVGYMCGKGGRLGDFSGFTICENVHVNVKATEEEKQMILEKLLTGVIMPYNS